jgi:HEAT repeat protein
MLEFESLEKFWKSNMFSQHKFLQILDSLFERTEHEHLKKLIVMNIFSHLPADKVVPFFLKTMETADENIQSICLRSCSMFNDPDIVSYVEPYLQNKNARIRSHALISLWNFQKKESLRNHLHQLFENDNHESVIAGLYAIGELGDITNHSLVLKFSNHDNIELRLHALIARAKLKDKKSFDPLMKMLFSEDEVIAQKVFGMLKRVPDELREELLSFMQREIAKQVWNIVGHHPKPETIQQLSPKHRTYLRRLYLFANKHDDILVLEQASLKT